MNQENAGQTVYLACQPILDRRQEVVAYELLFRAGADSTAQVNDPLAASASVIDAALSQFGLTQVVGRHRAFINVSRELLLSETIELLPRKGVVLELLESIAVDAEVIARCRALKARGFTLALDDYADTAAFTPLLPLVEIVKIDILATGEDRLESLVRRLRQRPLRLLAEKVETPEQFELCRHIGFELFQGYHFARPALLTGQRVDPARTALLQVLKQLNTDAALQDIEATFQLHPGLSLNLLRLVNSVGMGGAGHIDTLRHALHYIGTRQLTNWVQLLLYAGGDKRGAAPLMLLAAQRGKLMEILARHTNAPDAEDSEVAFTVGLLSLVDVLFRMPMADFLDQLNLSAPIREVLLTRAGRLGGLLQLVEALEQARFDTVHALSTAAGIDATILSTAQIEAMRWAEHLKAG